MAVGVEFLVQRAVDAAAVIWLHTLTVCRSFLEFGAKGPV